VPRRARGVQPASTAGPLEGLAETAAALRANVEMSVADLDRPSIMVTSAVSGEGRTTVTVNLARSLALSGHRVILVDFDLRTPGLHHQMGVPNDVGVADVLLGRHPADACLRFVTLDTHSNGASRGLYILPAGKLEGEPTQLLGGKRTRALLRALESEAAIVLVDGPSVLGHTDAVLVGRLVGGVLLVIEAGVTPTARVEQAQGELTAHQVRLLGAVLNKARETRQ
jgi:succinoglycan biosynthesis transport protein ExoP